MTTSVQTALSLHRTFGEIFGPEKDDAEIVQRVLPFAKRQPTEDEKGLIYLHCGHMGDLAVHAPWAGGAEASHAAAWRDSSRYRKKALDWWDSRKKQRMVFWTCLQWVHRDPDNARRKLWPTLDKDRENLLVIPRHRRVGVNFEQQFLYFPLTEAAATGLVLDLLLANEELRSKLRPCKLEECGEFFLGGQDRKRYCTPEHRELADANDVASRKRRQRDRERKAQKPRARAMRGGL